MMLWGSKNAFFQFLTQLPCRRKLPASSRLQRACQRVIRRSSGGLLGRSSIWCFAPRRLGASRLPAAHGLAKRVAVASPQLGAQARQCIVHRCPCPGAAAHPRIFVAAWNHGARGGAAPVAAVCAANHRGRGSRSRGCLADGLRLLQRLQRQPVLLYNLRQPSLRRVPRSCGFSCARLCWYRVREMANHASHVPATWFEAR